MLKRLRHAQKEKNQMDVEVPSGSGSGGKRSKVKDTVSSNTDEEVSDVEMTVEDTEMTDNLW